LTQFSLSFSTLSRGTGRVGFDSTQQGGDVGPPSREKVANLLQPEEGMHMRL